VRDTEKVLDAHGVATQRLHGKGYRGYTTTGPGDGSESLVVLRGDHYINVIFFNLPSGTAARFAPAAAANLG